MSLNMCGPYFDSYILLWFTHGTLYNFSSWHQAQLTILDLTSHVRQGNHEILLTEPTTLSKRWVNVKHVKAVLIQCLDNLTRPVGFSAYFLFVSLLFLDTIFYLFIVRRVCSRQTVNTYWAQLMRMNAQLACAELVVYYIGGIVASDVHWRIM